jgi:hypothetical protein
MHVLAVDLAGALLALAGFLLAFRQRALRRLWDRHRARRGRRPLSSGAEDTATDPAHYAMIIFGTMMMAFGIIIAAFTTIYAGLT